MKVLLPALAILAMICTALATVVAAVFCLSMGANATEAQVQTLKYWTTGLCLLGLAGVIAGIFLMRMGLHGWATIAGILPTLLFFVILIVAMKVQS